MPTVELVADRFLADGERAIDLATAMRVNLIRHPFISVDRCEAKWIGDRHGSFCLIDHGRHGTGEWFEAWGDTRDFARLERVDERRVVTAALSVEKSAGLASYGPVVIKRALVDGRLHTWCVSESARRLRANGFVTFNPILSLPAQVSTELRHRHLALVISNEASVDAALRWIRCLAEVSHRAHVLIDFRSGATPERAASVVRETAPLAIVAEQSQRDWLDHCARTECRIAAAIDDTNFHAAETLLNAILAEGEVRGCPVPASIGMRRSRLRRRKEMQFVQELSTLLQLVQDSDDDQVALKRGCSWVRENAGAEGVGIVAIDGASVVAADGLHRRDLDDVNLRQASHAISTFDVHDQLVVSTPMRYAGVTIGFAVLRGRRETAGTLTEAGRALASACAPALRTRLDTLAVQQAGHGLIAEILGMSPSMAALRDAIARAAPTPFPVLIEGESGTGKELVARALHKLGARRDRRFCPVNCAALTDELVEAELFGYARGAFTGAVGVRVGLFEEAHQGTLFLDEVSELSPRAQAKLLRALQEREIRRLGENGARAIDVRVLAATNQALADSVLHGRFREDLLFRLAVVRIRVPPLRERVEDIPLLAQAFWRRLTFDAGKRIVLGADAVAALCRHRWPGNVRELQNVIAGLVVAAPIRGRVSARHVAHVLSEHVPDGVAPEPLDDARRAFERRVIAAALARHGGRRVRAARELGLSRQGLTKAIKRLGLTA